MSALTRNQESAIRCALADLVGSWEAYEQGDSDAHNWKAHQLTISELRQAFAPIVKPLPVSTTFVEHAAAVQRVASEEA